MAKKFYAVKMVRLPEFLKRGTNVRKALTAIPAQFSKALKLKMKPCFFRH